MSFPGPRACRHAQHRLWNGQSLHCQPGFGWNTPASIACNTSETSRKSRRLAAPCSPSGNARTARWRWSCSTCSTSTGGASCASPARPPEAARGSGGGAAAPAHRWRAQGLFPRPEPPSMTVVGCGQFLQRDFAREGLCRYGGEPAPSLGSLPERTDLLHGCYMERRLERTGAEVSGPLSRAPQKPHSAVRLMSPAA